eukprot:15354662-Ditylum_brightwellii.AAC.1
MRGTVLFVMRAGGVWQRISLAAPEIFLPSSISCDASSVGLVDCTAFAWIYAGLWLTSACISIHNGIMVPFWRWSRRVLLRSVVVSTWLCGRGPMMSALKYNIIM